jgi:manganese oxidase
MADMGEMEMPGPDNTLPMMTGFGQFGPMEMGGMFTVVKVREGLAPDDYRDPGPYKNPAGTVAYEYSGSPSEPPRRQSSTTTGKSSVEVNVVKPGSKAGHSGQH